jgi:ABC-type dipeptide/oligopeptide/nickel transport system permease subunit
MRDRQKIGGAAALIEAATYVIGLGLFVTFLAPYYGSDDPDLGQFVAFLAANGLIVFAWHAIIFLVNGIFLVVLALALQERL